MVITIHGKKGVNMASWKLLIIYKFPERDLEGVKRNIEQDACSKK